MGEGERAKIYLRGTGGEDGVWGLNGDDVEVFVLADLFRDRPDDLIF